MRLNMISSLILRMGRKGVKEMEDPIPYTCMCGKDCLLGKDSFVMVRWDYDLGNENYRISLCDHCVDNLVDVIRYGPRVILEKHKWELRSRVARMSMVVGDMGCFKCSCVGSTHLFVKFDDLDDVGKKESYSTLRVCARCAISYLQMMVNEEVGESYKKVVVYG